MSAGQVPNWTASNAPVFDELVAAHPYSHPIGFTASDDGRFLYLDLTDQSGTKRYFLAVADISGRLYVYDIGDLLYGSAYTTYFTAPGSGQGVEDPSYLHFGVVLQQGAAAPAVEFSPVASIDLVESLSDDERNYVGGLEVDVRPWQAGFGPDKDYAFLYTGISRVGIQVCTFDPDSGALAPLGLIQTPGDATGLYLTDQTGQPAPNERLLFVGDYDGGIRVYRD